MTEQRYVIIDTRKGGDIFTDILAAGTTEKEAIRKLEDSWAYLTDAEKAESAMELALLAVDAESDELVSSDDDGYQEAADKGWDTLSAYTPVRTMVEA